MKNSNRFFCIYFSFIVVLTIIINSALFAQVIPVSVTQDASGNWQLMRGGKPFYVKGVGGFDNLDKAVEIGANSIRTWGSDNAGEILDKAQEKGLTVLLGLWMQHERHGFDYNNKEKVQQQLDYFTEVVIKYKDHPALLAWGVGNEVDLFYTNTNVWYAVNDVAAMIHKHDSNHPTMTVTAGLDTVETRLIIERAPHIDIYGINTYGDIGNVYDKIRTTNWNKPYMITEWGPSGHWEVQKTIWGAPIEQSSSEKALSYNERFIHFIQKDNEKCIGSYVFLWGHKQETTSTWYGLFDEHGYASEAVDVLQTFWTGKKPENSAPSVHSVSLNNKQKGDTIFIEPYSICIATALVNDADNDKLIYNWDIVLESQDIKAGGDVESRPTSIKGLKQKRKKGNVTFRAPDQEGAYRLFFYVYDNQGHYAYLNIPFYVLPASPDKKQGPAIAFKKASL
jgi:hypothetical protein